MAGRIQEKVALTEAEVNAEKLAKPRPDLIPLPLMELMARGLPMTHEALRSRGDLQALQDLGEELIHKCGGPWVAARGVGEVMAYGFRKHGPCTWRVYGTEQADPETHFRSMVGHLIEFEDDERSIDKASGQLHLHHALAQLGILLELMISPPRPPRPPGVTGILGEWPGNETSEELHAALKDLK